MVNENGWVPMRRPALKYGELCVVVPNFPTQATQPVTEVFT